MRKALFMATLGAVGLALAAPASAAGDAAAGEKVAKKCLACHDLTDAKANKVGPALWGVAGGPLGTVEGFKYSDDYQALAKTGIAWNEPELMAYLEDPTAFLRDKTGDAKARSKMTFKLKDEKDRQDVIAYLMTLK